MAKMSQTGTVRTRPMRATPKRHQSHIKATSKPVDSQAIGTPKPPQGYPKATSKPPQGSHKAPPKPPRSQCRRRNPECRKAGQNHPKPRRGRPQATNPPVALWLSRSTRGATRVRWRRRWLEAGRCLERFPVLATFPHRFCRFSGRRRGLAAVRPWPKVIHRNQSTPHHSCRSARRYKA
jgi:hypothetical protein